MKAALKSVKNSIPGAMMARRALLKAWRNDYTLAAKQILGLDFWWGQRLVLRAPQGHKFTMVSGARGMGKTFLIAVLAILIAILFPRSRVLIVSASYRQSKLAFAEIRRLYERSKMFKKACKRRPTIAMDECYLELKNGSRITALPLGDGTKIRGQRAHFVLVDEWVQVPLDILNQVILPMMNVPRQPMAEVHKWQREMELRRQGKRTVESEDSGNRLIMFSTGWWQFHPAYNVWEQWVDAAEEGDSRYAYYHFTCYDIPSFTECSECLMINEGTLDLCPDCGSKKVRHHGFLDMDQLEMQKRVQSDAIFAMENLAGWVPDTKGFYSMRSVFRCTPEAGSPLEFTVELERDPNALYVLGVDPAREQDRFAFVVLKVGPTADKVVYSRAFSADDYAGTNPTGEMANFIRRLHRIFKFDVICMDRGGGGSQIRDLLHEEVSFYDDHEGEYVTYPPILEFEDDAHIGGDNRLELVNFTVDWINDTAFDLLSDLDNRKVWFPSAPRSGDEAEEAVYEDVQEMVKEMVNIIPEPLPRGGRVRFKTSSRSGKKDRVTALWLASYGSHKVRERMGLPSSKPLPFGVATRTVLNTMPGSPSEESEIAPFLGTDGARRNIDNRGATHVSLSSGTMAFNPAAAALKGRRRIRRMK